MMSDGSKTGNCIRFPEISYKTTVSAAVAAAVGGVTPAQAQEQLEEVVFEPKPFVDPLEKALIDG